MSLATDKLWRRIWLRRERSRYKKWHFYRWRSKRPLAERLRLRKKWWDLYEEARAKRVARDKAIAAAQPAATGVSDRGIALIAEFEGFRGCPYRDAVGVWTIGYGYTHGVGPNTKCITRAQGKRLLKRTVDEFARGVRRNLRRTPTQNEFDAMVSLAYNIGLGAFSTSTVLRQFNAGNKRAAGDAFLMWDRAGGRRLAGLTRRRRAERALFLR